MAAGLGSELFTLATSFDPYGAYKEGARQPAQEELKDIATQQQLQEARVEQAQSLGQMNTPFMPPGAQGGMPQLAKQAQQMVPQGWNLSDAQGMPTVAGEVNQNLLQGNSFMKQGQQMMRQAQFETDPTRKERLADAGRRLLDKGMEFNKEGQQMIKKATNDALYSLGTATNPDEWNNVVKGWDRTGIPIPQGFPTEYSPENIKKVIQMAPMEVQQKITESIRKRDQEARAERSADLRDRKLIAALQGGNEKFNAQISTLEQDIGTGYKRLDDLISQAKPGDIPGASPAFGRFMKGDGIYAAAEAAAVKGSVPPGLKKNDAILLGLAFDIASARGGGRGQLSDTKIREVQQMMPLSTDDQGTRAYKIGLIENALDEANKSLPPKYRKDKAAIMKNVWDESKYQKQGGGAVQNTTTSSGTTVSNW